MNGTEMDRGTPRATPRRNPNQIQVIIKSPLSTKLTAHIHNVWSVWVVTQAYYPKKQSLATLWAMPLMVTLPLAWVETHIKITI